MSFNTINIQADLMNVENYEELKRNVNKRLMDTAIEILKIDYDNINRKNINIRT